MILFLGKGNFPTCEGLNIPWDSCSILTYKHLHRTIRPERVAPPTPAVISRSGLEIKVCMRTYRLFFVSHTEDSICWRNLKGNLQKWKGNSELRTRRRRKWIEAFDKAGWQSNAHM